jgi:two-component sensor histidine kinase
MADIPFSGLRIWLASNVWAPAALVIAMAFLATGLRLAIGVWIGAAGLVMFLPFIFIIGYLAGPGWGYIALVLDTALIWLSVLRPYFSFALPSRGESTDLVLMVLAGVGVIEFVRILDRALARSEYEKHQTETLLRELMHRTGNHFQMVSSMLSLVRWSVADPLAKKALQDAAERVTALGSVQTRLATTVEGRVDIGALLSTLVVDFGEQLHLDVTFEDAGVGQVSQRTASSVALITHELVANAAEHARKNDRPLLVVVRIERRGAGRAALVVEDNGTGLPVDLDVPSQSSLGFTIVRSYAGSVGGNFDIQNKTGGAGTRAVVEFSLTG